MLGALSNKIPSELPRLMRGVRTGHDANLVYRILQVVEQFPSAGVTSISRALGSRPGVVSKKVDRLVDDNLLVRSDGSLYLSDEALAMCAKRDRVHVGRPLRRFGVGALGLPTVARHRRHDGAAFSIVSIFMAKGFSVCGGWRGDDYSGGQDAIAPDALIYMDRGSSAGEGWVYFEYERRANSARSAAKKLRGYLSRGSKYPVMVVAKNESMSNEFRRQASEAGHPLWAASIPEIRVDDPGSIVGTEAVWKDTKGERGVFLPPKSRRKPRSGW